MLPALLALCMDDADNVAIVSEEMSPTHLTKYLTRMEDELSSYQRDREADEPSGHDFTGLFMVSKRFPVYLCDGARAFLKHA